MGQASAIGVDRQRLGVGQGEPRRRRGGRRGERGLDSPTVEKVKDAVKPAEGVLSGSGFHSRPGEHAKAHQVDSSGPHQVEILCPGLFWPLFGVVVSPEAQSSHPPWPPH